MPTALITGAKKCFCVGYLEYKINMGTKNGLSNEDVTEELVVSVTEPGVDCIRYSDTLYLGFMDGIADRYKHSLVLAHNPTHTYLTASDTD